MTAQVHAGVVREGHAGGLDEAVARYLSEMQGLDRQLRRRGEANANAKAIAKAKAIFQTLKRTVDAHHATTSEAERERIRQALAPMLFRGRFWNRSRMKPHGYAGDYRLIDDVYSLGDEGPIRPFQTAMNDCRDAQYWALDAVKDINNRRHWLAGLLEAEAHRLGRPLRVLDVACGGARYIAQFLRVVPGDHEVVLVDQDPAALAFCEGEQLASWRHNVRIVSAPVRRLGELGLSEGHFDLAITAGLLDYLEAPEATPLLATMGSLVAPGGLVAFTNYHPEDPSNPVREWLCDWQLVLRNEDEVRALLPESGTGNVSRSPAGTAVFATWRR